MAGPLTKVQSGTTLSTEVPFPPERPRAPAPAAAPLPVLPPQPSELLRGPQAQTPQLAPPGETRTAAPAPLEPLPVFDWSLSETPPAVPIGALTPRPARSNDPEVQRQRDEEWQRQEDAAQARPAVGTPWHQRRDVQEFFTRNVPDAAERARLMALVERIPRNRAETVAPPSTARPSEATSFERSVRGYLNSGIQRGTAYALEFGPDIERIARAHGLDASAIYGTLRGETNMGGFSGGHNAFQQLVKGAFEGSRQEFYRGELTALIQLTHRPEYRHWDLATLGGSSAGALGWCQFMPSNLVQLADGRDPWNRLEAAELAARFHQRTGGWVQGQPMGAELTGSPAAIRRLTNDSEMTAGQLRAAGFTIPRAFADNVRGRVYRFGSDTAPEAFFSGPNAVVVRRYNWGERHYGDRAGLLALRIEAEALRRRPATK